MSSRTRPLIRYYGGKWRLAPWIIAHFPPHRDYVEPYGGAASVLLRKPRSHAEVYNDLDSDVVNLFRVLQDPVLAPEFVRQLRVTPFAREEFELAYEPVLDRLERARRLLIRSYMGHGSNGHNRERKTGFRARSGLSRTTGARDWAVYPDSLVHTIMRLAGVVIENRPALDVMRQQDGIDTLFFVDPPYVLDTRSKAMDSSRCFKHEMTDEDHAEMVRCLSGLDGMVVLSGYDGALYRDLLDGWTVFRKDARTHGGRARTECLWLNEAAHRARVTERSLFAVIDGGKA